MISSGIEEIVFIYPFNNADLPFITAPNHISKNLKSNKYIIDNFDDLEK